MIDEEIEKEGDLIQSLISEIRRIKSEKRISLKLSINEVKVFSKRDYINVIERNSEIIKKTCHIKKLVVSNLMKNEMGRVLQDYSEISLLVKE